MADGTVRPTNETLRSAGLLPGELPRHLIARGESVPAQPQFVSMVFGPAEVEGDRTSIRVARVRYPSGPAISAQLGSDGTPARGTRGRPERDEVALIEVDASGVRFNVLPRKVPLLLVGILLTAWNIYWTVRALREWHEGHAR